MSFELFVEVTRNNVVESRHFGAAAVCDYKGNLIQSWGNPEQLIFPRSAVKPMLAIDVIASGAAEHFALSDGELALACASHQGEEMHQTLVEGWLKRLSLSVDNLTCGSSLPDDTKSAHRILASGRHGCRSHHNCSGKHAAFLTNALHLGLPTQDYHLPEHPLQQRSLQILSDLAKTEIRQFPVGIDGCGLPAPTMPLLSLAHAVARFAKPAYLSSQRAQAIYRLHDAVANNPLLAAGNGNIVSELCAVTDGAILPKTGAEGILTAALPEQGLGIVLKIADGAARPRSVALLAILDHLGFLSSRQKLQLKHHIVPDVTNSRGEIVGEIRAAKSWL